MLKVHFCFFQSDFSGRVVNNDHFLYWGDIIKTNEEGIDFHVQVSWQSVIQFPPPDDLMVTIKLLSSSSHLNLNSIISKCKVH